MQQFLILMLIRLRNLSREDAEKEALKVQGDGEGIYTVSEEEWKSALGLRVGTIFQYSTVKPRYNDFSLLTDVFTPTIVKISLLRYR